MWEEPAFRVDEAGAIVPRELACGSGGAEIYLTLYATGIRHAGSVTATAGDIETPVTYAGPQSEYVGLDQVNLRLGREFAGHGLLDIVVRTEGSAAPPVFVMTR